MSLSKILIPALVCMPLIFGGCATEKKIANSELSYTKILNQVHRNQTYLSNNIKNESYLQDKKFLEEEINKFHESSEHVYTELDTIKTIYKAPELSLSQLQKIYLMYEYLQDSPNCTKIGKIIDDDVLDIYSEHGGIIKFNRNSLYFKTFESNVLQKDTLNNTSYNTPNEAILSLNIAFFHLHATKYNKIKSAGPSNGDWGTAFFWTHLYEEYDEFLITPIKKGKFNIDYYGGDMIMNPIPKVLDLGNFSYDTIKRE
jgi:hypothetical protein